MKKILIAAGSLLLLFIVLLLLLPVFLRNNITGIVEKQAGKYLKTELSIQDISLNMFRNFPNLQVTMKNAVISGKNNVQRDTLVFIPLFSASVNVMSVIKGQEIIINHIVLKDAQVHAYVSSEGEYNWDILPTDTVPSVTKEKKTGEEKESQQIRLNDIRIEGLNAEYRDETTGSYTGIKNLNLSLSGNFAEVHTTLKTNLSIEDLNFRQRSVQWVNRTGIHWQGEIAANFQNHTFEFLQNDISVNDLKLALNGKISSGNDKCNMDIRLSAPDTRFESLLALIPQHYRQQTEVLQTSGNFTLDVIVKGEYFPGHLPRINGNFSVEDASLQYSGMPEAVRQINLQLEVTNPGGSVDSTRIDLKKLNFEMAGNPFSMQVVIVNPSDPLVSGNLQGTIDFTRLKQALPLQQMSIEGKLTTLLSFDGKYAYIEKEQYEKFKAQGDIRLNHLLFKNSAFPRGISVPDGTITLTPSVLKIRQLTARMESSDFTLQGNLSNYLAYFFKHQTLQGNLTLNSQKINLNELLKDHQTTTEKDTTSIPDYKEPKMMTLPLNLDLQLQTNIRKLIFDKLTIQDIKGNLKLNGGTATLSNLSMNMLEGSMKLNGNYHVVQPQTPHFNLSLNVAGFDIHSAYESFSYIRQHIPIAMNCEGKVSADLSLSADLTPHMEINPLTLNGKGYISSQNILINQNPALEKLSSTLKNEELSRISISALKIEFEVEKGNLTVKPFQTSIAGNPATIYGRQSVKGEIDYTLSVDVQRKYFGKDIENVLQAIPGSGRIESLNVEIKVEGTLEQPEIKPDLSKALKTIQKEAEKEVRNKARKGLMKGLGKILGR